MKRLTNMQREFLDAVADIQSRRRGRRIDPPLARSDEVAHTIRLGLHETRIMAEWLRVCGFVDIRPSLNVELYGIREHGTEDVEV